MNWSGSVQTQLAPNWLLELLYQGSSGVRLVSTVNMNQLPKSIYDSTDLTLLNAVYAAVQNYRPYPQFGTIIHISNAGHNTYHGFTTRVEKRYASDGLILNAHYTWSKNLAGTAGDGWQYYNWALTKAPTTFDTRHRVIIQGMYDIPVGQGRRFLNSKSWLDHIVGGWNITVVETVQSGPAGHFQPTPAAPTATCPAPRAPINSFPTTRSAPPTGAWAPTASRRAPRPRSTTSRPSPTRASSLTGTLGAGTNRGLWLYWPQYSLAKGWAFERYRFTLRVDANSLPTTLMATTPDLNVNLTNPATFAKFAPQTGSSYSTMGALNGQIIICGRFEF